MSAILSKLAKLQAELAALLAKPEIWKSLLIDYRNPIVERLYCDWDDVRVSLHRIQPCTEEEAFFHPHPWPSAILIVDGGYEMRVGYGAGIEAPANAMTLLLAPGSRYAMEDRDGWHAVRPLESPSYSIMINGKKWDRQMPDFPAEPLNPLSAETAENLLKTFSEKLAAHKLI
jgi:hypothetical protein